MNLQKILQIGETSISALDIGCSGFKPMEWERLGNTLDYFGVDPLEAEIEKLQTKFPNDRFLSAFIFDEGCTGSADITTSKFFSRTSAAADMRNGFDLIKENFNSGNEVLYSDKRLTVSEVMKHLNLEFVELLKIDVDGDDFPILKAFLSNETYAEKLLAFEIESQFHGDDGDYGNRFANILNLANSKGFYLYKLDSYTYSRDSLRKPYVYSFPAQTFGGQVLWGDALFVRDGLDLNDPAAILKLVLILVSYDLEDCAFELIENKFEILGFTQENVQDIKKYFISHHENRFKRIHNLKSLILHKIQLVKPPK